MKIRSGLFWGGVVFLILLLLFAVFGPTARHDYLLKVGTPHLPPSGQFWFGTDEQGRDVFARLAYGARVSLFVGFCVQFIALAVGITLGMISVLGPKWLSVPILRLTDGMFAFPDILLAILIIGVWNLGITPVIVALAITAWPAVVRLVRGLVASLKDREFVVAARAIGGSQWYVAYRHLLPHLWGTILALSMVDMAGTILAESALSFLGIGVQPPTPSWGGMINNARLDMNSHPMLLVWPCLFLSASIFALNFVGDGLREMLDPRSARS